MDNPWYTKGFSSKDFRPSFGQLAEIRALVPPGTPYMACTATASRSVRIDIIEKLEMMGCVHISASPDRPNIFYGVRVRTDIEKDFHELTLSLKNNLINTPRVIVYCQSLTMCSDLYAHFHDVLGNASYYPAGAEKISDNRLFGMFHSCTPQYNKTIILKSLLDPNGIVRVVFATVALGMGIDLKDLNAIIHYGAPQSIDDYFQESGRGGRHGDSATSIIYWKPIDCPVRKEPLTVHQHELIDVRRYLENVSVCRRKWLIEYFNPACAKSGEDSSRCCDICNSTSDNDASII